MKTWSTYYILLTAFALALAGCSDEMPDTPPVPPTTPEEDGTVALTIQFPNSSVPGTYAIDAKQENEIDNLHLLSFIHDASIPNSYKLVEDKLAYHIPIADAVVDSLEDLNFKKAIRVKVKNMKEKQRLVLIANVPSSVNLTTTFVEGDKMGTIVDKLIFDGGAWRTDDVTVSSFPMFGQMTDSILIDNQHSPPPNITFNMIRAVARIDVGVDIDGTGDPALGFGSIFKIQKVHVYNVSDHGYIAPHKDILNITPPANTMHDKDTIINKVNLIASEADATYRKIFSCTFPTSGNMLQRSIYIPESDIPGSSYDPAFLVIEATYYDIKYWYRVDFTKNGEYVPMLRNHNYIINIKNVRAPGYGSAAEAAAAPVSRFGALVLSDETDIGLKEVVSYNNEYYLAVSTTHLDIDWMNQTAKIYVRTSFPGGWSASVKTGNSTLIRASSATNKETVLDSLMCTIPDNNFTGAPRPYTFEVKAGVLTLPITITQSPGSNSYIFKPNTDNNRIPWNSADVDGNRSDNRAKYEVLWSEGNSVQGASLNVTHIRVKTGGQPGNGVVVIRDASDKILYSWHVWVTEYDPEDPSTQKSNNGLIFMDRNLGASSSTDYGLYYQWGRKDPFYIGTNSYKTGPIKPNIIDDYLEQTILYPDSFYTVDSTPYDWIGASQNNSMWSTTDGKKGPYDPCPFGWRVPVAKDDGSDSPWYGFTTNSWNGITYPLAGYIDAFSGVRSEEGASAGVWGASARGQQAAAFKYPLPVGITNPRTSAFRAYAYPVRCVKDTR
jgi:hypothetical protein